MKAQVLIIFLGISSTFVGSTKITKRGVLSGVQNNVEGNIDLPPSHHAGVTIALETESRITGPEEHSSHDAGLSSGIIKTSGHIVPLDSSITQLRNYVDLGSSVQNHVHVVRKIGIPLPQPYPVPVQRNIPVKVHHPVDVLVERPYHVPVPVDVPVKVYKDIPVPVEKRIPVPVKVHVKIPVEVPYKVYHAKPVPVPIFKRIPVPFPETVIVKRPIPVAVHTHIERIHDHHEYQDHHQHHHHHH